MRAGIIAFAVCAAACLAAHAAILLSVLRARTAPGDATVPRPRAAAEIVWALVPAVALALVLTATWDRIEQRRTAPPAVIMKVAR